MTNILEYIKNIGFFLILVSVVCNTLPENGFKKYCKLFCGLVLVILVLTPVNEILNFDGNMTDIFSAGTYDVQMHELENKLKMQEQLEMDNALQQYESGIQDMLEDVASEQGLHILDVEVDYSYSEDGEEVVLDGVLFQITDMDNHSTAPINIDNIDNINVEDINIYSDGQGSEATHIEELSHSDRPKVIEFIEEASIRLGIDSNLVSIEWKE